MSHDQRVREIFAESIAVKTEAAEALSGDVAAVAGWLAEALRDGNKLVLLGNGGSAADAQHIAAEFVGRFILDRPALPALALTTDTSVLTCVANDMGVERMFARQVEALGQPGDVLIALSTSGRSPNVVAAVEAARAREMRVIALTGRAGGPVADVADLALRVPSEKTARIQEIHITIGHVLCEIVEETLHG